MSGLALQWRALAACLAVHLALVARGQARAAGCMFTALGEGRVAAVIDGRSFCFEDGREIRFAGIEPANKAKGAAALAALIDGRDVTLHGEDDTPDRYGRHTALVFSAGTPVQSEVLRRGEAVFAAVAADKDAREPSPPPRPRPPPPK